MRKNILTVLTIVIVPIVSVPSVSTAQIEYTFAGKWTCPGYPRGIAVNSSGEVYVSDFRNKRIRVYDASDLDSVLELRSWGGYGREDGKFSEPHGVTIDGLGNVYVNDAGNFRIQKFTPTGTFETKWGSFGPGDGEFYNNCWYSATGSSGNVYVADNQYHRIQKFTSSGTFISKWGSNGSGNGQFRQPLGIAVNSLNRVYVADERNHRIQVFDSSGNYLFQWGGYSSSDGYFYSPIGIAIDSMDNVFVCDSVNNRIQVFSSTGMYRAKWGSDGSGDGEFKSPLSIAIDSEDNVYVTDYGTHRIQKFTATGQPSNQPPVADAGGPYVADEGSQITFDASASSDPDGDTLEYRWDFNNDGTWDTGWLDIPIASVAWDDNRGGTARVEVTDAELADADTANVTVNNVPPTVSIDAVNQPTADFVLPHDLLILTGSLTDPGSDTHTIAWDFGDGTAEFEAELMPLHAYAEPGEYTVTLTVIDDDGGVGTASIDIVVESPAQATVVVIQNIVEMDLPQGTESSLTCKLENAIDSLENGQDNAAVNKLEAFIQQVEAQRGKKLTEDEADKLIADAQAIIDNTQDN